ncbi:MAG TPA: tetratricopeptide repeat protein [Flavipsychrobacter sp.]|nr:tetratricopeptide repeat protein [Flavipsychrobacter sp.]
MKHILLLFLLAFSFTANAQSDPVSQARIFTEQKDYRKAIELYAQLYERGPLTTDVYDEYLKVLLLDKNHKDAEKLVERHLKIKPQDAMLIIDLGKVHLSSGKEKKAEEQFEKAVQMINGDDILTTKMASTFVGLKQDKYAIKTYERAIEIIRNPYFYSTPLARLYAKTGDIDKAVNTMLSVGPMQMPGVEDTKSTMLELLGSDPKKLQLAQKALIKRINEQPENSWFAEILTWLYTQKDDWEGALIQIQALDERNQENGARLVEFARTANKEEQYGIAITALEAVVEKGKGQQMYAIAKAEKLNVMMQQLQNNPAFTPEDVSKLQKEYELFFTEFPQYYNTESLRDYAMLEAQYAGDVQKGIALLKTAIEKPGARRDFNGWAKLQLGDYYLLSGKIWDASLTYSQVDKDFREDMLGEEARFRNAKLAYYRGDFDWAQGQLSVLKASTSELIANDALYLSVLITENIPPDSNLVPLERFAYADLLLFQNKDKEAAQLLDSISQTYPKHPLNDDIMMLRAKMAVKHRDYNKALDYLREVYEKFEKDVLADDAIFQTAEVYDHYLKQPDKAKEFYEKLILDFPGSTYVQTARAKLSELQNSTSPLP